MIMTIVVGEVLLILMPHQDRKFKFLDDLLNDQRNDVKIFLTFFSTASEQAKWNLVFGAVPSDTNFKVSLAN